MSKNVALFIDVANIYYAARGQDVDVDYIALLKHATKGRDLIRAYAYSGLDPENENQRKFLDFLSKNGYKVVHKDIRKFGDGRVKANLDIELVVDLFRLQDRMDIAVIVSGDGDFASAIRALQDVGVRCEVISFRPNTSSDLIAVADEFTDIMKIIGIGRAKNSRRLSMPEMPAKEMSPEFGFREASRGVAAAALAALREGEKPARAPRRRSGSTTETPVVAEAEETAAAASPESPQESGDGDGSHRRRRRRGGRGRGRGRRAAEQTTTEAPEASETPGTGEIGWEEFDDVSELTDLGEPGDEREFAFTEADPETLAALGMASGGDVRTETADEAGGTERESAPPAEGSAAPRRRGSRGGRGGRRVSNAADETAGGEATESGAIEAAGDATSANKPTRRGRTRKAAEAPAPEAAAAEETAADPKPTRRGRTRKAAEAGASGTPAGTAGTADAAASERPKTTTRARTTRTRRTAAAGSGEPETSGSPDDDEGIWQRFRSARGGSRRTS